MYCFVLHTPAVFVYFPLRAAYRADFLICIEMLVASLAHFYIFPYRQWEPGYRARLAGQASSHFSLRDNFAVRDFVRDIQVQSMSRGHRTRSRIPCTRQSAERSSDACL